MTVILPLLELACGLPVTSPWSRNGLYSKEPVTCSPRAIADWVACTCRTALPDAAAVPSSSSVPPAVSQQDSVPTTNTNTEARSPIPASALASVPEHSPLSRNASASGASSSAADESEEAEGADACTSSGTIEQLRLELGPVVTSSVSAAFAGNFGLTLDGGAGAGAALLNANGAAPQLQLGLVRATAMQDSSLISPLAEFILLVDQYLFDNPPNVAQLVHSRFFELLALLMHKVRQTLQLLICVV